MTQVYRPTLIFLPLVMRSYPPPPPVVQVADAPGTCPGLSIDLGTFYRDNFDGENDNDCFAFTAVAGQTYVLETGDLGPQADTLLALYAASDCGTTLAENDDINYPHDVASRIVWTAPADGVYCALVRSYDWRVYGLDTGYTLRVTRGSAMLPQSMPPSTDKPAPPPTPTPDTDARISRRVPGLAAPVREKPTPLPTPVKPPVVPTPSGLATPVQTQIVLLPETGHAGYIGGVGLVLTVLGAGAVWCIRRSAA
ncbi:MAG: PPC domain-containing protein [Anaerolineae bacterium]